MPYPNQHAAPQMSADGMLRCRMKKDEFGPGIHAIYCVRRSDSKSVLQSVRFDREKFTEAEAKAWLKAHDMAAGGFEPATGKAKK